MKEHQPSGNAGIILQKESISIRKEFFRKVIHLATAFVPAFLVIARTPVLVVLFVVLVFYCTAEVLRCKGKRVFGISAITEMAARKRDSNKFVLGPVTLAIGVLLAALIFDQKASTIGICALAVGDGLASLVGKVCGRHNFLMFKEKTLEGSLACFCAIFASTFFVTKDALVALIIAVAGTIIEVLPLKDFDNLLIPLILSAISQCYFHI